VTGREDKPTRRSSTGRRLGPAFVLAVGLLGQALFRTREPRSTDQSPADSAGSGVGDEPKRPSGWLFVGFSGGVILFVVVVNVLYAWSVGKWSIAAAALLVAAGAFAAGGMLGFLFAVPRVVAPATSTTEGPVLRSSNNLEEISDWLTKILVGLGLVELGKIIASGSDFMKFLEPAFGDKARGGKAVALADITFFAVAGFIALYYITRVFVAEALKQVEDDLRKKLASLQEKVERESEALSDVRQQQQQTPLAPPAGPRTN
jgi:hypothetical protein